MYLVAVMLGPGYGGVPFGDKSTVLGFGMSSDGHVPEIRTCKNYGWLMYGVPPPEFGFGMSMPPSLPLPSH